MAMNGPDDHGHPGGWAAAQAGVVGREPRLRAAPAEAVSAGRFIHRPWVLLTAWLLALPGSAARAAPQTAQAEQPPVQAVEAIGFTVADLDRSIAFFRDVLTFQLEPGPSLPPDSAPASEGAKPSKRTARMRLGDERIELTQYVGSPGRPFPADSRSNDLWFQHIAIIVSDMDRAYERVVEHDVRPASRGGPQRLPDWNANAGGIRAFYFRDPDGHFLEILEFPPDKGDPRWHAAGDRLFLGIDHTAIVVSDTASSLAFYRDRLGFKVVGGSENYGPEQEALNNVDGAHLRITTLRAASGPGIELLEYLAPRDGRPFPPDAAPADLLHWETALRVRAPLSASDGPGKGDAAAAPPDRREATSAQSSMAPVLVRDPDGHAMRMETAAARPPG